MTNARRFRRRATAQETRDGEEEKERREVHSAPDVWAVVKVRSPLPEIGRVFEVPYPYVKDTWVEYYGTDETDEVPTWKPGVRQEAMRGDEETYAVADGMGAQVVTVVGIYKPGRYPTRVFYSRQWRDPDGKLFGRAKCRSLIGSAFARLVQGYRYPFELTTGDRSVGRARPDQ